jgi:hypothetical protein
MVKHKDIAGLLTALFVFWDDKDLFLFYPKYREDAVAVKTMKSIARAKRSEVFKKIAVSFAFGDGAGDSAACVARARPERPRHGKVDSGEVKEYQASLKEWAAGVASQSGVKVSAVWVAVCVVFVRACVDYVCTCHVCVYSGRMTQCVLQLLGFLQNIRPKWTR